MNDLDIYIHATEENAHKMIDACLAYGIPRESIEIDMFLVPKMVTIGEPPLRIELLKNWMLLISSMLIPGKDCKCR